MTSQNPTITQRIDGFKGWRIITQYLKQGEPVRRPIGVEHLQNWLDSGLIEQVPYDPHYTRYIGGVNDEFIAQYVWLKPTELGLACHHLHKKLNVQRDETKKAYQQGKIDAVRALTANFAQIAGVEPCDVLAQDTDDDDSYI